MATAAAFAHNITGSMGWGPDFTHLCVSVPDKALGGPLPYSHAALSPCEVEVNPLPCRGLCFLLLMSLAGFCAVLHTVPLDDGLSFCLQLSEISVPF